MVQRQREAQCRLIAIGTDDWCGSVRNRHGDLFASGHGAQIGQQLHLLLQCQMTLEDYQVPAQMGGHLEAENLLRQLFAADVAVRLVRICV